jgi:hypothetical protein
VTTANGRRVEVYLVQQGLLASLFRDADACGTVIRKGETYLIFVDEAGHPQVNRVLERLDNSRRFSILHEYAHILHGDVLMDDPERISARSPAQRQDTETYANGYAAQRIYGELQSKYQFDAARDLMEVKKGSHWIGPLDSEYATQFPDLKDEHRTW